MLAELPGLLRRCGLSRGRVSLRGHGESPTAKPLHQVSIADYIDDVRATADELGSEPVLVGHSLGGFVIQRYLEDRTAPAAVLVGSVPPQGVLTLASRVWRRRPSMTLEAWERSDAAEIPGHPGAGARIPVLRRHARGDRRILPAARRSGKRSSRHDRSDAPPRPDPPGEDADARAGCRARRVCQRRRGAGHGSLLPHRAGILQHGSQHDARARAAGRPRPGTSRRITRLSRCCDENHWRARFYRHH
ncbi:alpha/beta fold hydrolase [Mycobacterium sp. 050134]|uniref:alpha/beta fold hydrolase n=1 Tax=Mycobacterium sp. 050134 TaxID=3096111 RepID=UPI003FA5514C